MPSSIERPDHEKVAEKLKGDSVNSLTPADVEQVLAYATATVRNEVLLTDEATA
jgi:hypothetical protein